MDIVVYKPVGTLSIRHDFLSSWNCLLASSPDALCELSWHLTQCCAASLKAACVQRPKKEIQGPEHLLGVLRDIQDLEPPVEYAEGSKDLEGLILGRTFTEKMIKFTPSLRLSPPSTRRNGGGNRRPLQAAKDQVVCTVPRALLSVHKCVQSQ